MALPKTSDEVEILSSPSVSIASDFGLVGRAIGRRFFSHIAFSGEDADRLRQLSEQGEVVHLMRTYGALSFHCLSWLLLSRGLPPIRALAGPPLHYTRTYRRLFQDRTLSHAMDRALSNGASALIFLRPHRTAMPLLVPREDPLQALLARARISKRPIYLIPELLQWRSSARNVVPTFRDLLFGDSEEPGVLLNVWSFFRNHKTAHLRVGQHFDLSAAVKEGGALSDEQLVHRIRGTLFRQIARETRAISGPPRKTTARLIEQTLRDKTLGHALDTLAAERAIDRGALQEEAKRDLEKVAARHSPLVISATRPWLTWIFTHLHAGVDLDQEGFERAQETARRAPVIYCPSHKSHLDYLLVAWLHMMRGITVPLVAAGANLSFFPLGTFFSHCGAFFLRRSFRGDPVYASAFRAYVKQLLREGYTQEFFIEGGRSRTGKLLSPKLGMLSFEVDAFLEGAQEDLFFVPVSIDYDDVVEAQSYMREMAGGVKEPESIRTLLAAPKVLTHRYGRVYVSFGEPISLRAFLKERLGIGAEEELPKELTGERRRSAIRALAQAITFGISRVSTLTSGNIIAAALHATPEAPTLLPLLEARCDYLRDIAAEQGIRLAPGKVGDALLLHLQEEGLAVRSDSVKGVMLTVPSEKRAAVAYQMNGLVNAAAPRSLVALALHAAGGEGARAEISARTRFLGRLLRFELALPVGIPFDAQLEAAIQALERDGLLERDGERLSLRDDPLARDRLGLLRALFRDLVDGHFIAYTVMAETLGPSSQGELTRAMRELGARLAEEGKVARHCYAKPTLDNAISAAMGDGILVRRADGSLRSGGGKSQVAELSQYLVR